MVRNHKHFGFTLVELITVILVLSIVSIGTTSYIRFGIDIYRNTVGRDRQISDSRFLIERITREVREALPNSVRLDPNDPFGKSACIEFVPIVASSSYVDIPVSPDAADNQANVVQAAIAGGSKIAVYPLAANDVYVQTDQTTGKIFDLKNTATAGQSVVDLELNRAVTFNQESPTQRYFLVDNAVAYCVVNAKIYRYSEYWRTDASFPPSGESGVLMAEHQTNTTPFSYETAVLNRNAVVQLNFEFSYDDEILKLYHEVHVVNVP